MTRNIQYKKLGEICDFISGGTPSKSKNEYWKNGNIPWIKISDFKEKYIKFSEEKITKIGLENSSAKILKKGTILYTIFASVGKVAILDIEATTNQAIVGVNLKEDHSIDKNFLYYFLCSIENNIKKQARGVAQNNINISILKNINTPILPMSFQKNIVKTLNKLENILENFKQKKLLINSLNKSLFISMFFSGNKNFERKKLKENVTEMFIGPFGSDLKNEVFVEKERGYCVVYEQKHAIKKRIDDEIRYITKEKYEVLKRFRVDAGDIIVSCRGTIGKIFALPSNSNFGIIHPSLMKIKLKKEKYNNTFFEKLLEKYMQENLYSIQGSSIKMAITAKKLGEEYFIIPPIELQNEFSNRIEKIEKLSFEIEEAIKEAENLYNSLIFKYFD